MIIDIHPEYENAGLSYCAAGLENEYLPCRIAGRGDTMLVPALLTALVFPGLLLPGHDKGAGDDGIDMSIRSRDKDDCGLEVTIAFPATNSCPMAVDV